MSKIIKQLKVTKSIVYDVVRRYKELGNTKDCLENGRSRSCCTKSNINAVRERVKRDSKPSMKKWILILKWMQNQWEQLCKLISSFLPWKQKSILLSFNNERELVFFGICWNLARRRVKSFLIRGKVQSIKRQSSGPTLRGRVNRLSPPEVSICHGLDCSVKNLKISSDFCETGCQS